MKEQYFYRDLEEVSLVNVQKTLKDIKEQGYLIVRIFAVGSKEELKEYKEALEGYPSIVIGHTTAIGPRKICVQAVSGSFDHFEYVQLQDKNVGTYIKEENSRYLFLSDIDSQTPNQAHGVFLQIKELLQRYKFEAKDIVRFWNYMKDILQVYREFNVERDHFFQEFEITDYPAATGIESDFLEGKQLSISLDAVQEDVQMKSLHSDMQCEAYDYGPKFNRGKVVNFPRGGKKKVYISGTSSVDKKGLSILLDNPVKNVEYVLESFEHLLEKGGADINNLQHCIVYAKNQKYYDIFLDIYNERGYHFEYLLVFVDICRDDFFFELEGVNEISIK